MRTALACFIFALLSAGAASAFAAPKLVLSTDKWDFGEIYQWTNPSTTIEITNSGNAPLDISDVKASCGCTATFLSNKSIKPGGKATLKIKFASYITFGKVEKIVRLTTNDPDAKQTDIAIKGFVKDDKAGVGELDKDYVDLGVVAPYETRTVDVIIRNRGNVDLNIKDIELPKGWFMDSAQPTQAKVRSGIEVSFGYRPAVQSGPIDDTISIRTSGIDGGLLKLKVAGYVADCSRPVDEVAVTPAALGVQPSQPRPLVISVKNGGKEPVTIEGVDSSLDTKSSELSTPEVRPGETGTVTLDLDASGASPGTKGYVYIRLGIPVEVR